jgi:hypothetical protein
VTTHYHDPYLGGHRLLYTPDPDPERQAEADFFRKHGVTRAQWAERERAIARQEFEDASTADLNGEPPDNVCDGETEIRNGISHVKSRKNLKGLSPQRARYARYHFWKAKLGAELSSLEAKKVELEGIIAAPAEAQVAIQEGLQRTAAFLLGRAPDHAEGEAEALADKLAVTKHRAEAARVALPELEKQIERARVRVKYLSDREHEFLHPALAELVDHLGPLYIQQIRDLRSMADLLFGLAQLTRTYADGNEVTAAIKFPRIGLPSIRDVDGNAFIIGAYGSTAVWQEVIESLRRDPRGSVEGLIPAPQKE